MEGSETGGLVPSGTITEVETWVKFSKIPLEFLTVDALSMISSSIGSPVRVDEETYEKMEDAKWPPPLRRNKSKSRRTFVKILMRISVTAPLPPSVDVVCPQGREYTVLIDSDPTPKICLNCFCAGHFDFECCGTKEATVEIMEDDVEAGEDCLGVDLQLVDCFDSMSDEVDGEQGAVTTDGFDSYEDSTVVEAVDLPAATCDIGNALVGELEAVRTIVDGLFDQSLVERTAAVLEVQPLLPATIAADGSEGTVISDGFVRYEDPPAVKAVQEVSPHSLPPASCELGAAKVGDLEAVQTFSDFFDDKPSVGKEIDADLLATVGESKATDLLELATVSNSDGFFEQPLLSATIAADGSEGTVISDGFGCGEDPPFVEVVLEVSPLCLPPASCEFGAAKMGELEAVQTFSVSFDDEPLVGKDIAADPLATVGEFIAADRQKLAAVAISDGFDEEPTVERMATVSCLVDEQVVGFYVLFPFEPGPVFLLQFIMDKVLNDYLIAAGNLFGLLFCSLKNSSFELSSFEDFYAVKSSRQHHKWREKTVEQRVLEGDSGSGEGFLGVDMQDADCIGDIFAYIDGVQGAVIIDRALWYDNPTDVEAALVEDFHIIEQVFFVVKSSNKHHIWSEKSDVQGLVCCSNVLGLSGFDEQSSVEIKETSAVLPFFDFGAANFGTSPAAFLQGRADSCFDQDFFEELVVLQSLGRFMAATNSTHDQLIFKIQHKWREKSMDWSADRIWVVLLY